MNNVLTLTIESEAFTALRLDFNQVLQKNVCKYGA